MHTTTSHYHPDTAAIPTWIVSGAALVGSVFLAAVLYGLAAVAWCAAIQDAPTAYQPPKTHYGAPTAKSAYKDRYVHVSYPQPKGYTRAQQDTWYRDGTSAGL